MAIFYHALLRKIFYHSRVTFLLIISIVWLFILGVNTPHSSANYFGWKPGKTGDFYAPAWWSSSGEPYTQFIEQNADASIREGGTVYYQFGTFGLRSLYLGHGSTPMPQTPQSNFNMSGGTLNLSPEPFAQIQIDPYGAFSMSGGKLLVSVWNSYRFNIYGKFSMNNGIVETNQPFRVRTLIRSLYPTGGGEFFQSGGTVKTPGIEVEEDGLYYLAGGTLELTGTIPSSYIHEGGMLSLHGPGVLVNAQNSMEIAGKLQMGGDITARITWMAPSELTILDSSAVVDTGWLSFADYKTNGISFNAPPGAKIILSSRDSHFNSVNLDLYNSNISGNGFNNTHFVFKATRARNGVGMISIGDFSQDIRMQRRGLYQ